jgi:hypothetical protein
MATTDPAPVPLNAPILVMPAKAGIHDFSRRISKIVDECMGKVVDGWPSPAITSNVALFQQHSIRPDLCNRATA